MATVRTNLGGGTVINSPGVSGTELVLDTGQGASLPMGGFHLTLTPPGQLATFLNSEIVGVFFPTGGADNFIITRAQKGTTAQNIEAGWTAVLGVYDDDVISSTQIDMQMFRAEKTTTQATGTSGSLITIGWQDKVEFKGRNNFDISRNQWVAPCDGWFDADITLNIEGGDGTDDSMDWGITKNSSWISRVVDSWRFNSRSGVEYPSSVASAFPVLKGDVIRAEFSGVQSLNVNLLSTSRWVGRFYPYKSI